MTNGKEKVIDLLIEIADDVPWLPSHPVHAREH